MTDKVFTRKDVIAGLKIRGWKFDRRRRCWIHVQSDGFGLVLPPNRENVLGSQMRRATDGLVYKGEGAEHVECAFCGKPKDEVSVLIAGPTAMICNECVSLCVSVIGDHMAAQAQDTLAESTEGAPGEDLTEHLTDEQKALREEILAVYAVMKKNTTGPVCLGFLTRASGTKYPPTVYEVTYTPDRGVTTERHRSGVVARLVAHCPAGSTFKSVEPD
jgi:hypothetical protein